MCLCCMLLFWPWDSTLHGKHQRIWEEPISPAMSRCFFSTNLSLYQHDRMTTLYPKFGSRQLKRDAVVRQPYSLWHIHPAASLQPKWGDHTPNCPEPEGHVVGCGWWKSMGIGWQAARSLLPNSTSDEMKFFPLQHPLEKEHNAVDMRHTREDQRFANMPKCAKK